MSENSFLKNLTADYVFVQHQDDKYDFLESDLVELKPFGLSLTNELSRPFMIFKDLKTEEITHPVAMSSIEAGVTLSQATVNQVPVSPHRFLEMILTSLDIKIEKCVFIEIKELNQYARLFMTGHPKYASLKVKASEAISLCLHLKVPFFATMSFIQKSKQMNIVPQQTVNRNENGGMPSLLSQISPTGYVH